MPYCGAAHGETGEDEAIFVDCVLAFEGVEDLEDVDLTGEFVGAAIAAIRLDVELVFRFTGFAVDEVEFEESFAASVAKEIDAPFAIAAWFIVFGYRQKIRLHRAVDFGEISAWPASSHPWRLL